MALKSSLAIPNSHVNLHSGGCDLHVITDDDDHELIPNRQDKTTSRAIGPTGSAAMIAAKKAAAARGPGIPAVKYVPQSELDAELSKLEELSQAALAGDTTALDQLRAELDNCPHVWRHLADLQLHAEHKLIELVAGADPLKTESFRKRCSELRHELLEGEASSLLVKMAASRVVMCWMFCQFLEVRALEVPQDLRCIKQLEQAERRYQVAMRTFQMARHADLQLQRLTQNGG